MRAKVVHKATAYIAHFKERAKLGSIRWSLQYFDCVGRVSFYLLPTWSHNVARIVNRTGEEVKSCQLQGSSCIFLE